jgi:hypothetical protein
MITKIKKLFLAGLVCCGLAAVLTSCSDDNTSGMNVSGACLVEELVLNGQYTATINTETCAALGLDFDAISQAFAPFCTQVKGIETAENF